MKIVIIATTLVLGSSVLVGCSSPEMEALEVDDLEPRINGETSISGCSAYEASKINDAVDYLVSTLDSEEYSECLADAIPSGDKGDTVEDIIALLQENKPTAIRCRDAVCGSSSATGCAPVGINTESLDLQHDHVQSASVAQLAGTIVHEVMHNKGYQHFLPADGWFEPDDRFRVVRQAQQCVSSGVPWGLPRSEAPGDTELARVGGNGGAPFELTCPGDGVVRGMQVDSSSRFVNRIRLTCDGGTSGSAGEWKDSRWAYNGRCLANQVVIGIYGSADSMFGQLGMLCASEDDVIEGVADIGTRRWLGGLSNVGHEFERTCPAGMAVKRLYGRSGARIDQLSVVCEEYPVSPRGPNNPLAIMGTAVGDRRVDRCIGFGAMTGLWGSAGGEVDRIGARCSPTNSSWLNGAVYLDESAGYQSIEAFGGQGGVRFGLGDGGSDQCPAGAALIAARRSGSTGRADPRGVRPC
ncbi:MAG: hypothetical protein JKY37_03315 [Nannocystaceae bacterium]|nr:hypothetical protein [Nannocystaceae bacterium]